jgi:hypothetical protein
MNPLERFFFVEFFFPSLSSRINVHNLQVGWHGRSAKGSLNIDSLLLHIGTAVPPTLTPSARTPERSFRNYENIPESAETVMEGPIR